MGPLVLAASAPLYDWTREGVAFVVFGVALGIWICAALLWLGARRRG